MENNKLIAEFMSIEVKDDDAYLDEVKAMRKSGIHIDFNGYTTSELKYHTSWDWLMPVAEKCLTTDEPSDGQHYFINDALLTCNIEVVYDRVVEFIKEYDNQRNAHS